ADLVALARPHLVDPYFTIKAAAWYGASAIHCPPQYLAGKEQIFRNSARDRQEWRDLRLKAKPKNHRDTWEEAAESGGQKRGRAGSRRGRTGCGAGLPRGHLQNRRQRRCRPGCLIPARHLVMLAAVQAGTRRLVRSIP